jgi:hypothetical protein
MAQEALTSSTSVQASGKTGDRCSESGPYRSSRNAKVVVFVAKGQRFPPDTDGKATTWSSLSASSTQTLSV